MTDADADLLGRARRAYERGRLLHGLRAGAVVVPMTVVSYLVCGQPVATLAGAVSLAAFVTAAFWRGQDAGLGARLGLVAGVPPLLLPLVVECTGHACGPSVCILFPAACIAGGVAGGVLLGQLARRQELSARGLASAAIVAGLTGTLGCLVAGAAGVLGLVLGLAGGMMPALVLRRT